MRTGRSGRSGTAAACVGSCAPRPIGGAELVRIQHVIIESHLCMCTAPRRRADVALRPGCRAGKVSRVSFCTGGRVTAKTRMTNAKVGFRFPQRYPVPRVTAYQALGFQSFQFQRRRSRETINGVTVRYSGAVTVLFRNRHVLRRCCYGLVLFRTVTPLIVSLFGIGNFGNPVPGRL